MQAEKSEKEKEEEEEVGKQISEFAHS